MIEKIGIVGGGQLGRMLTVPAKSLGFEVTVLEKGDTSPAAQVGARQIDGGLTDPEGIRRLVAESDVTTWEIEHIGIDTLVELYGEGNNIQADPNTLAIIQDKLVQKDFLGQIGVPVAPYIDLDQNNPEGWLLGEGPYIVKTRRGGFDGRGNLKVDSLIDPKIHEIFGEQPLYAEQVVDFDKELSVVVTRSKDGDIAVYPTVETIHEDNICHTVISPADISPRLDANAVLAARTVVNRLQGAGVFAIEMFAIGDEVLVNEIAPRVHNSGHHTIESNVTSQFEQHIRAVTGLPLGSVEQRAPAAVMVNILGTLEGPLNRNGLEYATKLPDTHVHLYGKTPRPARKIGHITALAASREDALLNAQLAREVLTEL